MSQNANPSVYIDHVDFYTTFMGSIPCDKFRDYASDHISRTNLESGGQADRVRGMLNALETTSEKPKMDVRAIISVVSEGGKAEEYCVDMFHVNRGGDYWKLSEELREYLMALPE